MHVPKAGKGGLRNRSHAQSRLRCKGGNWTPRSPLLHSGFSPPPPQASALPWSWQQPQQQAAGQGGRGWGALGCTWGAHGRSRTCRSAPGRLRWEGRAGRGGPLTRSLGRASWVSAPGGGVRGARVPRTSASRRGRALLPSAPRNRPRILTAPVTASEGVSEEHPSSMPTPTPTRCQQLPLTLFRTESKSSRFSAPPRASWVSGHHPPPSPPPHPADCSGILTPSLVLLHSWHSQSS